MTFQEIDDKIETFYTKKGTNLIDDFYNIALSHSIRYDRISGFFRSSSLAAASKGIANFIENNGHMRLLCGAELTGDDRYYIENAEEVKDFISKNFIGEYENLEDELVKNYMKLLGWMIANSFLEIKIGIPVDKKKGNELYPNGMLHSKRGLLYDEDENCIMFIGSNNETLQGWTINVEDFTVDKSWKDDERIAKVEENFELLWNNDDDELLVFDIPNESYEYLIKRAPPNDYEAKQIIKKIKKIEKKSEDIRNLFPHQEEAIENWFKNNKQGIFEMATGTGKTFTALKALEKLYEEDEDILTVIACPFAPILNQWEKDIKKMNLGKVHTFYGTANQTWRKEFDQLNHQIYLDIKFNQPNIILTTHDTFSMDDFIEKIESCKNKKCLIVDEMHHVGAKGYNKGVSIPNYDFKLGLSATPSRHMDYEGTKSLIEQFGGVIFKFTILEALKRINPKTGKTFLTPYCYFPTPVELNEKEKKDYKEITNQIGNTYHNKNIKNKEDILNNLYRKRKKIINEAENKYGILREILRELDHKKHLIIFCHNQKQIDKVKKILHEERYYYKHQFTQHEPPEKREEILKDFDEGRCEAIVSIKVLDEGVDVPSADQVIIMSSTNNPAEYIQRRGRVLRRYEGKEKADIYDLCVIDDEIGAITEKEGNRMYEFSKIAKNKTHCINLLKKWGII